MTDLTILFDSEARISSLDIAKETGKNHKEVMRDIRKAVKELSPKVQSADLRSRFQPSTYGDVRGRERPMYSLSMRAALHMMAGYSDEVRDNVIGRCVELHRENVKLKAHIETRSVAAKLFRPMTDVIKQLRGDSLKPYHITNENRLIALVVFGMTPEKYRKVHGSDPMDNASAEQLELVAKLRQANASFMEAGLGYEMRKELLETTAAKHVFKQLT